MKPTRPVVLWCLGGLILASAAVVSGRIGGRDAPGLRGGEPGPLGADQWFFGQRAAPDGRIHLESRRLAIESTRRLRDETLTTHRSLATAVWEPLGPTNIGGRVTDVVSLPSAPDIAYAAAASGGVWKTQDGGAQWTPVFDGHGTLAVGALAIHPLDPDIVYAGTGEANPGGGSLAYDGNGVWRTLDGGASWTHLGLSAIGSVGRLAIDPNRPSRIFVAAMGSLFSPSPERGLYRSLDGGASWTRVLFVTDSTGCVDVAIDPVNSDRVFAVTWERTRRAHTRDYGGVSSAIYRSTDGGDTWTRLGGGLPGPAQPIGRIGIALSASNPQTIYASFGSEPGLSAGFYRSTNGGDTWTLMPGDPIAGDSSYSWWFGRVWVDPSDPLEVWVAGLQLYRSDNGGVSWSVVGDMHVDHHAMAFGPTDDGWMWEGNDGGLYRSDDGGLNWTHQSTMPITQMYTIEVHPAEPFKTYSGNQDNFVTRTPDGSTGGWDAILGGDGQYVVVDPLVTQVIYAESQYGALARSINGGASFSGATSGISGADRKNWSTPVVADLTRPGYPTTRLYYGANRLYRTLNAATSWAAVSPDLTDGAGGSGGVVFGTITTIGLCVSDSATIYVGTDDGNVWVSSNYAASWQPAETGLPKRWVTRIVVDPANAAIAYATFSGLRWNEPLSHVFRTSNRGATWTDISGNLPDAPVNDLAIDPRNPAALYVATDVGVFATGNGGVAWAPLGSGMPEGLVVSDLDLIGAGSPVLYAGTYGRSGYRIDLGGMLVGVAHDARPTLALQPARPNPWRSSTTLEFVLPAAAEARLRVVDVSGRHIATIAEGRLAAGRHEFRWDGRAATGRVAPPGTYFFRLDAGGSSATRRTTRLP